MALVEADESKPRPSVWKMRKPSESAALGEFEEIDGTEENGDNRELLVVLALYPPST
jgi:hypothetical protein